MLDALSQHWPEYLMEAALLGCFMISACLFATLIEHPGGPVRGRVRSPLARRAAMGAAMGCTAVVLIYSPWGGQSGAHMNPATTLTFYLRGKLAAADALFYVTSQFVGAAAGVGLASLLLRARLRHAAVRYVVTQPGRRGASMAWMAELMIAFGMMLTVLLASNSARLTAYTGYLAGALVALYITFEAPLSGMSLNPARSFGSALGARDRRGLWIYLTAPVAGMLLASAAFTALPGSRHVYCAKLNHCNDRRCIFRCEFERLRAVHPPQITGARLP